MNGAQFDERLRAGHQILGLGIRASRSADVVRWAKAAGYESIWVDMEHSTLPVDVVAQMCACAADLGMMPWVRVPERDYGIVNRVLDGGALGIIVPRIESAEQARLAVTACKFPPLGQRSQLATLGYIGYRTMPAADMNAQLNHATSLQVLIESPAGIDAASDIAAVPGVDVISLGCNDLSAGMGYAGQAAHPDVLEACLQVIAAARQHDKLVIVGGMPEGPALDSLRAAGAAPFCFAGIDSDLFLGALRQKAAASRSAAA